MKKIFKNKTMSLIITILVSLFVLSIISVVSFNCIYSFKNSHEIDEKVDFIENVFSLMVEGDTDVEYQTLNRTINVYVASPVMSNYSFNAFGKILKKDNNIYQSLVSLEDTMSSDGYGIIESIIKENFKFINIRIIYYYEEKDNILFIIKNGDVKYSITEE